MFLQAFCADRFVCSCNRAVLERFMKQSQELCWELWSHSTSVFSACFYRCSGISFWRALDTCNNICKDGWTSNEAAYCKNDFFIGKEKVEANQGNNYKWDWNCSHLKERNTSFYKNRRGENRRTVQECGRAVEQAKRNPELGRYFED